MKLWMAGLQAQAYPEAEGTGSGAVTPPKTESSANGQTPPADSSTKPDGEQTPPVVTKPASEQTPKPGETDGKTPTAPPEKYELTTPDGGATYVDDKTLEQITAIAKKSGWSNDEAQAALNEHVANLRALSDGYLTATKADPVYGGDKLAESQRLAKAAIDRIRPEGHARRDSFLRFLDRFGGGNHIEVLSFLADLGKAMGEDRPASGRSSGAAETDAVAIMYGKTTPA